MSPLADFSAFHFPGWKHELLFSAPRPIHIEYCSGNGAWIAEKAKKHPEINWLAVEKRFDRTRKIWSKIKNNGLSNLVAAFAEGMSLSSNYLPSSSVAAIYVNFPDPWPKQRHAKHRIISPFFFHEASRVLEPGGRLIFVTDDEPYSTLFLQLASSQTDPVLIPENSCHLDASKPRDSIDRKRAEYSNIDPFSIVESRELSRGPSGTNLRELALVQTLPPPGYAAPPDDYGTSFFDSLFRNQGKPIYYHELVKDRRDIV